MKLLLVIYSCKKYAFLHQDYLTKYKNMGYDVFITFGEKTLENNYIINPDARYIVTNADDTFEALPEKTYKLFKTINDNEYFKDYDYVIKMDDDTELTINHDNLCNMISQLTTPADYLGPKFLKSEKDTKHNYHFGKCQNEKLNCQPFLMTDELSWGVGYFYILSKTAINKLVSDITGYLDILTHHIYEDMLVGEVMLVNDFKYIEFLQKNIVTNLNRPRTLSINPFVVQSAQKVSNTSSLSSIRKIKPNLEPTTIQIKENNTNINKDDDILINKNKIIDNKNKKEKTVIINLDLNEEKIINNNQNNQQLIKKKINPIALKSMSKMKTRIVVKK